MIPLDTDKDLLEALYRVEEIDMLELLGVTTEEIVEAFRDLILADKERFKQYLEEIL